MDLTDSSGMTKITQQLPQLAKQLVLATKELELSLSDSQLRTLLLYLDKLLMWNKAYNLTAITDPTEALVKHIIDCLAILPYLPEGHLLDIGTGAGLPAVIIAICQPDRLCTALDSNQKKIRFIKQVASELKLSNLKPVAARIEAHDSRYDVITSRAFASLTDFVEVAMPRLTPQGQLCAMKGKAPEADEVAQLKAHWEIKIQPLEVPRLNEARHLVLLQSKALSIKVND